MNIINKVTEGLKKSPIILLVWYLLGKPLPPPHIYKQKVVVMYGKKFRINTLIESGTFKGDMVFGVRDRYKKIITIELSDYFFKKARIRLKNLRNIKIIKGDSGKKIKQILKVVKEPILFWLDGHNSFGNTAKGELNTPIVNEVHSILNHENNSHVILIDDARCFNGKDDYPKISELRKMLKDSNYSLIVKDDIIRITPQKYN